MRHNPNLQHNHTNNKTKDVSELDMTRMAFNREDEVSRDFVEDAPHFKRQTIKNPRKQEKQTPKKIATKVVPNFVKPDCETSNEYSSD